MAFGSFKTNKICYNLQIAIEHNRVARAKYSEVWRFDIPCYVCFARCDVQADPSKETA